MSRNAVESHWHCPVRHLHMMADDMTARGMGRRVRQTWFHPQQQAHALPLILGKQPPCSPALPTKNNHGLALLAAARRRGVGRQVPAHARLCSPGASAIDLHLLPRSALNQTWAPHVLRGNWPRQCRCHERGCVAVTLSTHGKTHLRLRMHANLCHQQGKNRAFAPRPGICHLYAGSVTDHQPLLAVPK